MDHKQTEVENTLHRFMQIRDEVHHEIKKIGIHVATLEETNKRLVAHFDIFEQLTKKSKDQISAAIKAAALDLTEEAEERFSPLIDEIFNRQMSELNQAIMNAKRILYDAMEERNKRPFFYVLLWWLFLATAGFGVGSLVSHCNTPALPDGLIQKIDILGHRTELLLRKNTQIKKENK